MARGVFRRISVTPMIARELQEKFKKRHKL
jgi:hypothetical protein